MELRASVLELQKRLDAAEEKEKARVEADEARAEAAEAAERDMVEEKKKDSLQPTHTTSTYPLSHTFTPCFICLR